MRDDRSGLTESDFASLARSYIDRDLAREAGLFRVDSHEGAQLVGQPLTAYRDFSGMAIPYYRPGSADAREYRLRRDNSDRELQTDGSYKEKAKYLSPPGRGLMFYYSPRTHERWLADTSMPILMVEGEKKTLACSRVASHNRNGDEPRFFPVGLPGVWGWKRNHKGVSEPIPDFDDVVWDGRTVIILFDSNVWTNHKVRAARTALGIELQSRGANVLIAEMPKDCGVNGPDDLAGRDGPEAILEIIEPARPMVSYESRRAHYATRDHAAMNDCAKLLMAEWGLDSEDKETFEALNCKWGGRATKQFRATHVDIYKRIHKLPESADVVDKRKASDFVKYRIKKLRATVERTLNFELVKILEPGGKINSKTGARLGTLYEIDHSPFQRVFRRALTDPEYGSNPGRARERAARYVAEKTLSDEAAREAVRLRERRRAELEAQAERDAAAAQIDYEKWLRREALKVRQVMIDAGCTRVEVDNYFRNRAESLIQEPDPVLVAQMAFEVGLARRTARLKERMSGAEKSETHLADYMRGRGRELQNFTAASRQAKRRQQNAGSMGVMHHPHTSNASLSTHDGKTDESTHSLFPYMKSVTTSQSDGAAPVVGNGAQRRTWKG
ncbi:MAG: DUF3854 domain-containing protein [Blastocatellia bacterium]|nr:DUF3854 domain-containing protein [Blastocatellia bacterium]